MITEEDFKNWWASPVGMEVAAMLKERMNKIAHSLADGGATDSQTIYNQMVGRYKEIKDLTEMTYQELIGG